MKTLDNFSSHAIMNTEEVKGGTFGWGGCSLFSFSLSLSWGSCYTPKTTCYEQPKSSCDYGGYSNNCTPCYTSNPCKTSYNSCKTYSKGWGWC